MTSRLGAAALVAMATMTTGTPAAHADTGPCQAGIWDLKTHDTGEAVRTATSTHYCLFDGQLDMAEYRSFNPAGQLVFAGVSFHAWEPDGQSLTTLWLMVGDPGFSILPTKKEADGRLVVSRGWGEDGEGKFLERSETTVAPNHDYVFVIERSRDNGTTWQPYTTIEGTFRTATPPPHATALRDGLLAIRGTPPPTDHVIILDGLGELALEETGTDVPVRTIRFSSIYGTPPEPPKTWRTATWRLGAKTFTTEETKGGGTY